MTNNIGTKKSGKQSLRELIDSVGGEVLGQRLKRTRMRAGLSIRDLAEIAEVSKNTILRVEQGLPTHLNSIVQICRALRIRAEEITAGDFQEPAVVSVHKASDYVWYDMNSYSFLPTDPTLSDAERSEMAKFPGKTAFSTLRSSNSFGGPLSAHLVELFLPTPSRSHRGEEMLIVLEGSIRVWVAGKPHELTEKESIYFYAAEIHHYEPVGEKLPAKVLSIIIDPYPDRPGVRNIVK